MCSNTPYDARILETRELLLLYSEANPIEIKRALIENLKQRLKALEERRKAYRSRSDADGC